MPRRRAPADCDSNRSSAPAGTSSGPAAASGCVVGPPRLRPRRRSTAKKCEAAGAHPDDFRTLDDLARFPFTTKQDLRDGYPFGLFAVPRIEVVRVHASSGTTGKPTVVGYTARDIDTWASLMARSIRAAGGRPGDIVHVAYGYGLFTGGLGAHYGAERARLHGGADVRRADREAGAAHRRLRARRHHGDAVVHAEHRRGVRPAGARSARLLADRSASSAPSRGPKRCATTSSAARTRRRRSLRAVGSHRSGRGRASASKQGRAGDLGGSLLPEIIDPETGAVLPDGELGELVFTSLTKEALPVIRYRTRDLTRAAAADGAIHAAHGEGHGAHRRHADHPRRQRLSEPDRGAHPRAAASGAALRARGAPRRRARRLEVVVELDRQAANVAPIRDEAARDLQRRIKSYVGVTAAVSVCNPGDIERSIGKAKRVFDRR